MSFPPLSRLKFLTKREKFGFGMNPQAGERGLLVSWVTEIKL